MTSTPQAGSGELRVSVETSGTTTTGATYHRTGEVRVQPRCWYRWAFSGQEYAQHWTDPAYQQMLSRMPEAYRTTELPGWQDHQDKPASAGGWYTAWCRDDVDGGFVIDYMRSHPTRYFPTDQTPAPDHEVEPQILAQAAYDAMDLPNGTVRWNPSLNGTGATVVNKDTWIWVEDAATTATVRATIPTGAWAQVDAHITDVHLNAPGADPTTCPDLGTPWTPTQNTTTCSLVFHRSSADQPRKTGQQHPTATLTATTTWTASWNSWLDPTPQPLNTQTTTTTAEIPVAEIQSVVTR